MSKKKKNPVFIALVIVMLLCIAFIVAFSAVSSYNKTINDRFTNQEYLSKRRDSFINACDSGIRPACICVYDKLEKNETDLHYFIDHSAQMDTSSLASFLAPYKEGCV